MGAPFSLPVPFGSGVDRASGSTIAEGTDFRDLRNVLLHAGKAGLRQGLLRKLTLSALPSGAGITDVLEVTPLKSLGIGAAVAYNAVTRTASIWLLSGDATSAQYVADLWTVDVNAPFPKVLTADSYGKLVIAHDEAIYAFRQNTKVYDPIAVSVTDLTADLNTASPGALPVKFRGVERWLNYVVGWGYGTEDDGDRPEIVRISIAADPTNFLPNYYFVAGQRGDPIVRCSRSINGLLVCKPTESYLVFGSDRATFGIKPIDDHYGIIGSHLSVTVGGINYRWAVEGPRKSDGGPSTDIALPLDIGGTLPDALADPSIGDYAFAAYTSKEREVLFVFGRWAYVLHLKDVNNLRWSYRPFSAEIACFGELLDTGGSTLGSPLVPTVTAVVAGGPSLDVSYTASGAPTNERVEVWLRSAYDHVWIRGAEKAATVGETISIVGLEDGVPYEVAVRFMKNSLASQAYSSADASTWPAGSRGAATTPLPNTTGLAFARAANTITLTWTGGAIGPQVNALVEKNINGAGWSTIYNGVAFARFVNYDLVGTDQSGTGDFRVTLSTAWVAGNTSSLLAQDLGYAPPLGMQQNRVCSNFGAGPVEFMPHVDLGNPAASTRIERIDYGGVWIAYEVLAPGVANCTPFFPAGHTTSPMRFRARHEAGALYSAWVYSGVDIIGTCP